MSINIEQRPGTELLTTEVPIDEMSHWLEQQLHPVPSIAAYLTIPGTATEIPSRENSPAIGPAETAAHQPLETTLRNAEAALISPTKVPSVADVATFSILAKDIRQTGDDTYEDTAGQSISPSLARNTLRYADPATWIMSKGEREYVGGLLDKSRLRFNHLNAQHRREFEALKSMHKGPEPWTISSYKNWLKDSVALSDNLSTMQDNVEWDQLAEATEAVPAQADTNDPDEFINTDKSHRNDHTDGESMSQDEGEQSEAQYEESRPSLAEILAERRKNSMSLSELAASGYRWYANDEVYPQSEPERSPRMRDAAQKLSMIAVRRAVELNEVGLRADARVKSAASAAVKGTASALEMIKSTSSERARHMKVVSRALGEAALRGFDSLTLRTAYDLFESAPDASTGKPSHEQASHGTARRKKNTKH